MDLEVPTEFERDWERDVDGTVRMAVVGLGWFGRDVAAPAIEASDYCEVGAVVSGDAEKAADVADDHDAEPLTYDEYADGEAADAYDAVYIVTPNALHLPHVETAAELDKDVLCEKPLEATAERAEQVVEAAEAGDVRLMTAYRMQTTRSVRWVRDRIEEGLIGDPVQLHGQFSFRILAGGDPDQWRLDEDLAGGGSLYDIGVYPMNTARFWLGEDPTSVRATAFEERPEFDGVDQRVAFQLEFPGGATASCTSSYDAYSANRLEVVGTEGRIVVEPIFDVDCDRTVTVEVDGSTTTIEAGEPSEMIEEFDFFATKLLADEPIDPDGRHGLTDVETCEAVYESSETGAAVDLS